MVSIVFEEIVKKALVLLSGSVSAKILQIVYFFWVVKLLDPVDFGYYAVGLTLCLVVLYPLLEAGSELLITRETARGNSGLYYQSVYWKSGIAVIGGALIVIIGAILLNIPADIVILAAILIACRSLENGNAAHLRGMDLSKIESRHLIVSRSLSLVLMAVTVFASVFKMTIQLAIIYQIASILVSMIVVERPHIFKGSISSFSPNQLKQALSEGFPLLLNSIAWLIYFKMDVLLISAILDIASAGTYEVAYKILEAALIIPAAVMAISLRLLVRANSKHIYRHIFFQSMAILFVSGIVVAVFSYIILLVLYPLAFQDHQSGAVGLYKILALAIPGIFVAHLTTQCLVIQDSRYTLLAITFIGAGLNLALNIPLIRVYGAEGAAIATVVTETMILVLSAFYVWRRFGKHITESLGSGVVN